MINQRNKGHNYELKIISELKEMGYEAESSRLSNRKLDSQKVDIVTNFPFNIQCKKVERLKDPEGIILSMPKDKPCCIFTKKNHKPDLVILTKEAFYKLVNNGK